MARKRKKIEKKSQKKRKRKEVVEEEEEIEEEKQGIHFRVVSPFPLKNGRQKHQTQDDTKHFELSFLRKEKGTRDSGED